MTEEMKITNRTVEKETNIGIGNYVIQTKVYSDK